MYPSSPLRSTLNTGYITGVDMCKVALTYGLCPKWLSFMPKVTPSVYAQSDSLLCPKWPPRWIYAQTLFSFWWKSPFRSTYMWFMPKVTLCLCPKWPPRMGREFMPKVTLFYAPSDPLSTLNDLCPKWLKKCALSDHPTYGYPPPTMPVK